MANITSADLRKYNSKLVERIKNAATPSPLAKAIAAGDGLNKTERAYRDLLEFRKRAGEIRGYQTHALTFILGRDLRYTPEFIVHENDGTLTAIEIKGGFVREDSIVKFRAAQQQFPWLRWQMVQRCKRDQGGWKLVRD
jgi:hypothetical protein